LVRMDQKHDFIMTHCISSWVNKSSASTLGSAVRQGVPKKIL
jgi:hypothetical protein